MNVLLVTIDCLRRDRCGIYDHHRDTTPTLDSLGREGFVFDNAYATGPVTTESFPGILAGRLSAQTVAGDNLYQKCLPEGAPTIASHLRDEGWDTTAVISNPRIGEHTGADRGFESFQNLRNADGGSSDEPSGSGSSVLPDFEVGERLYQLRERMRDLDSLPYRYEMPFLAFRYYQYYSGWPSVRGEAVVDEFLDALADCSSPFFGWTHLMDVHGPLHPKTVAEGGLSDGGTFTQFRSHARRVSNLHDSRVEARYDSTVRYVDDQLRRIVDWLKSNDLWDETALVVTADHGDALYDRGIYGHPQHYMYDELLSVPLVVRVPGVAGDRIDRLFSLGWLHEFVAELGAVPEMDAPVSSSYETHLPRRNSGDGDEGTLLADSISHRGHSVVARRGDEKFVLHTGELERSEEVNVGPYGHYLLGADPTERVSDGVGESNLERPAREIVVEPESLRGRADVSGIDDAAADRLKQLGYAE